MLRNPWRCLALRRHRHAIVQGTLLWARTFGEDARLRRSMAEALAPYRTLWDLPLLVPHERLVGAPGTIQWIENWADAANVANILWIQEALSGATATAAHRTTVADWAWRFRLAEQSMATLQELMPRLLHRGAVPHEWIERFRMEVTWSMRRLQEMESESEDEVGTSNRSTATNGEFGNDESSDDVMSADGSEPAVWRHPSWLL